MATNKLKKMAKKAAGKKYLNSRIKHLGKELKKERISYGELAELGKYKKTLIRKGHTELAEAAGIPEEEFNRGHK